MRDAPIIRAAVAADACSLAALATQVFLHTYATQGISSVIAAHVQSEFTPQKFAVWLGSEATQIVVAEQDAHLLGYARIEFGAVCPERSGSTAELATLYVQEHFAGRGVGSALLAQAQRLASQRTQQALWLTVNAQNARAIAFYAAHAYSKIGTAWFVLGGERHENHVLLAPPTAQRAP
jgi:ribosomal protein S18 acetylase RimI-like enzyme